MTHANIERGDFQPPREFLDGFIGDVAIFILNVEQEGYEE